MRFHPFLALLIYFFFPATLIAGDNEWSCSTIPADIRKNASAIMRMSHTEIQINSATDIVVTQHYVVSVLNKEGRSYAELYLGYDHFREIASMHGWYYDEQGRKLTKLKMADLYDHGLFTQNFFDELRMKSIEYPKAVYPFTVEYEIKTKYTTIMSVPSWDPQPGYDCAVEQADVEIIYPRELSLKYRVYAVPQAPVKRSPGQGLLSLTAAVKNVAAYEKPDALTPNHNFDGPTLLFNINQIELAFVKGSLENWKSFGAFFYNLNKGRDSLTSEARKVVHDVSDTCTTKAGKVRALYEHLKNTTRYVNIVLGAGGWQTLEAKHVAQKGYGDCKALTNYMKAMLAEAGIPAYQALAFGGRNRFRTMIPDFAYNSFNHVILCVPLANDTMWLECTAKDLPAGYLSAFTDRRNVLLLTPDGGLPVSTPGNKPSDNRLERKATLEVNEQNELNGTINASYAGYWWEAERGNVDGAKSSVDKYFNSKFTIPTYTAGPYSISNMTTGAIPVIRESVAVTGVADLSRTAQNVFITPRVFSFHIEQPTTTEERTDSFQLFQNYSVCDTTIIKLSGTYTASQLPRDINKEYAFASYHTQSFFEQDNTLKIIVSYSQKEGVYPPAFFADYLKLSKDVNGGAAYGRVVLAKKQ